MKVFIAEPGRDTVLQALTEAAIVATCRMSYVEVHGALARARREGRATRTHALQVAREFDRRWAQLLVLEIDDALTTEAGALVYDLPLRAADAIHLACARALAGGRTSETSFACWDRRLWHAAVAWGFAPVPAAAPAPP